MDPWVKKGGLLRGTRYVTTLEPIERELLGNSAVLLSDALMERARTAPKDELAELTGMVAGHAEPPKDPALARVLPSFFRPGAEQVEGEAAMLRQLNEPDIIRHKLTNLRFLIDALGPNGSMHLSLSGEQAQAWIGALTDLRLFHSAQLEVLQLNSDFGQDDGEQAQLFLDWLGYVLDSLLQAMTGLHSGEQP